MAQYGGFGGVWNGRELDQEDMFEMAVKRSLGEQMEKSDEVCREMWSALANVEWRHESGDTAGYTFRAAGDLVAAVIGRGHYLDWYCNSPYSTITTRVRDALAKEGWYPVQMGKELTFVDSLRDPLHG